MTICLDVRPLQTASRHAGIGTYCYNLSRSLLQLYPEERFTYLTLSNYDWPYRELSSGNMEFKRVFRPHKPERSHAVIDFALLRNVELRGVDVLHMLQPSTYIAKNCVNIVTLHDLIPLKFPDLYLRALDVRKMYEARLRKLRQCDRVICVSASVKGDACALLGLDESKVAVIPEAVDAGAFQGSGRDEREWPRKWKIEKKYVLNVGGMDHRKNVLAAVRAFIRCAELHRDFQMVIVGRKEAAYPAIAAEIARAGKEALFLFPGVLQRQELVGVYKNAEIFIYPSLYEGFGLPPLEAMAAGVPSIVSNRSSLPEVVGSAAMQIDPEDEDAMVEALSRLAADSALRDKLREAGHAQVAKFSWDRTAVMTYDVYKSVMCK